MEDLQFGGRKEGAKNTNQESSLNKQRAVFLCLGFFSISCSVGSLSTHLMSRQGEARLHWSQVAQSASSH